jgi:hypothetical protein
MRMSRLKKSLLLSELGNSPPMSYLHSKERAGEPGAILHETSFLPWRRTLKGVASSQRK